MAKGLIKNRTTIYFLLLAYILVVAVRIEIINSTQAGGVLQNYHQYQRQIMETGGNGAGKWRDMRAFRNFLFLFGVPVYPLSAIVFGFFADRAMTEKNKFHKAILWSCAFLGLAILARFLWLDVFSAAAGVG